MRLAIALALAASAAGPALAVSACSDIEPHGPASIESRRLAAEDLVRLRDIGWSGSSDRPLSVSPDGRHVAFQLRQANIAGNDYCLAMIVLDLDDARRWQRVDTGGEPILNILPVTGGVARLPNGVPQPSVPQWFPDGRSIAYLRRDNGVTQIWRASRTAAQPIPLTHSGIDIEAFALSPDGSSIIYATRPGFLDVQKQIDAEGLTGFHYDERYMPYESMRPVAIDPTPETIDVLDLASGQVRSASPRERAFLDASTRPSSEAFVSSEGRHASLVPTDPERVFLSDTLKIQSADGRELPCSGPACSGTFRQVWWDKDGTLYFLKYEGWAQSRSALYRLSPGKTSPALIVSTDDLLSGCVSATEQIVCNHEESNGPREIVAIDPATGKITALYNPNPAFRAFNVPKATRLHWTNAFGIPTFGDLVIPQHRTPGEKLPLVIVEYSSRGFLRGGTGDEVPIPLLVQDGFAVLSFQRPRDYGEYLPSKTANDLMRGDDRDFADRRSVQSSLETVVRQLIDQGLVDPKRVGLTGLSDGASTVQFAMVNSHMFAAFSASQCCEEETAQSLAGPMVSDHRREIGFPRPGDRADDFWDIFSVVRSADRMNAPILVQAADTEYTESLQSWLVLRARGKAMDVYVYPDERHIMIEPRHRLAIYQRELAWFAYWLQDRATPFTSPAELERWQGWKSALAKIPVSKAPLPASTLPRLPPLPAPIF